MWCHVLSTGSWLAMVRLEAAGCLLGLAALMDSSQGFQFVGFSQRHTYRLDPSASACTPLRAGSSDYFAAIDGMKVTELKEHLRRLNKPVTGTKGVLQDRLRAALAETPVELFTTAPADMMEGDDASEESTGRQRRGAAAEEEEEDDEDAGMEEDMDDDEEGSREETGKKGAGKGPKVWTDWEPANNGEVEVGQEMQAEVASFSDLGVTVRLDGRYRGLIYEDELDYQAAGQGLRIGDTITVYVHKIRNDGKLDVAFRKYGTFPKLKDAQQVVLDALESAKGTLPLGDKSEAEEIVSQLGISKTQFKAAVGMLYKAGKIDRPGASSIALSTTESAAVASDEGDETEDAQQGEVIESSFKSRGDDNGLDEGGSSKFENWGDQQRADREAKKWSGHKIFVRGLPFSLTEDDAFQMFGKVGTVLGVRGMTRRDDGRPSGVAWIEYETAEESETAKKVFNGKTFRGRYFEVFTQEEMRKEDHRKNERGGGRGGGRGGDRGGRGGRGSWGGREGGNREWQPREGGNREWQPREGGSRDWQPREGGSRDWQPREGGSGDWQPRGGRGGGRGRGGGSYGRSDRFEKSWDGGAGSTRDADGGGSKWAWGDKSDGAGKAGGDTFDFNFDDDM